jgi:hypothetical protein
MQFGGGIWHAAQEEVYKDEGGRTFLGPDDNNDI